MTKIIEKNSNKAIFELGLEDKSVYMEVERKNCLNDEIADSQKFLEFWRNEPNPIDAENLNFGNVAIWKKDKKFKDAELGFSFGLNNPVPIVNLVCEINSMNGKPYVALGDGITRTIWLLANGAKSFPIECKSIERAKKLLEYVAIEYSGITTVEKLLG